MRPITPDENIIGRERRQVSPIKPSTQPTLLSDYKKRQPTVLIWVKCPTHPQPTLDERQPTLCQEVLCPTHPQPTLYAPRSCISARGYKSACIRPRLSILESSHSTQRRRRIIDNKSDTSGFHKSFVDIYFTNYYMIIIKKRG